MKRSLIFPGLSGWLSLANMLAIMMLIGFFAFIEWIDSDWLTSTSKKIGIVLLLVLTFPLATPAMVPKLHGPTWGDVIMVPLMVVLNAYLWGYCVAWILNRWGIVAKSDSSDIWDNS